MTDSDISMQIEQKTSDIDTLFDEFTATRRQSVDDSVVAAIAAATDEKMEAVPDVDASSPILSPNSDGMPSFASESFPPLVHHNVYLFAGPDARQEESDRNCIDDIQLGEADTSVRIGRDAITVKTCTSEFASIDTYQQSPKVADVENLIIHYRSSKDVNESLEYLSFLVDVADNLHSGRWKFDNVLIILECKWAIGSLEWAHHSTEQQTAALDASTMSSPRYQSFLSISPLAEIHPAADLRKFMFMYNVFIKHSVSTVWIQFNESFRLSETLHLRLRWSHLIQTDFVIPFVRNHEDGVGGPGKLKRKADDEPQNNRPQQRHRISVIGHRNLLFKAITLNGGQPASIDDTRHWISGFDSAIETKLIASDDDTTHTKQIHGKLLVLSQKTNSMIKQSILLARFMEAVIKEAPNQEQVPYIVAFRNVTFSSLTFSRIRLFCERRGILCCFDDDVYDIESWIPRRTRCHTKDLFGTNYSRPYLHHYNTVASDHRLYDESRSLLCRDSNGTLLPLLSPWVPSGIRGRKGLPERKIISVTHIVDSGETVHEVIAQVRSLKFIALKKTDNITMHTFMIQNENTRNRVVKELEKQAPELVHFLVLFNDDPLIRKRTERALLQMTPDTAARLARIWMLQQTWAVRTS
ncbi:MAG TPA: hypothetical protein VEF04_17150 [Blastocatellia bacterium]|nr:hypothetical protein [Blastocatellia bacterium]